MWWWNLDYCEHRASHAGLGSSDGPARKLKDRHEHQEDRDPRSAGSDWPAHRVELARFRIFLLRFLLPELDQRHHRYHRFLPREAGVPAVRPKELRPHEADVAGH